MGPDKNLLLIPLHHPSKVLPSILGSPAPVLHDLDIDLDKSVKGLSGYLLGGNPRKQTISQLFGVIAGTIVSVPAYLFVVQRDPARLGTEALPAPSAKVWAGVAELLAKGIDALPAGALIAIFGTASDPTSSGWTVSNDHSPSSSSNCPRCAR